MALGSTVGTGVGNSSGVSRPDLRRVPGTLLDVTFDVDRTRSCRGEVQRNGMRGGVLYTVVYYRETGELLEHRDFGALDKVTCVVVEPATWILAMLRRADAGYEGLVTPGDGKIWTLTKEDVEAHYKAIGEQAYLDNLGTSFTKRGEGGKVTRTRKKPDCVLGGVAAALKDAGDVHASTAAHDAIDASLSEKDRVKFAAQVMRKCNYEARPVQEKCALDIPTSENPVLVTLKAWDGTCRTHAITLRRGHIFDSAYRNPLPLTRDNLTRCLGVPYGGIVRGYAFVPQAKVALRIQQKRGYENHDANSPKRARST